MTKLLDRAIQRVRALPAEAQDDVARVLLRLAGDDEPVHLLTAEEATSLAASLAEAERDEFSSDHEIQAIWAKHEL
ncbi:hypothetical protein JOD31_000930 [Methylopila capsulata]|uniref:Uncharacterized protein n=1 Tax=Methylopila capsulata TaxID=61654 RepID=A0A9W6IT20_9HYPH|nr:hypothetical protein [Methylopila capsulata]MBM7850718.1 hypothetical protein [Methylopila capsulata]GLK56012.1 hypothetical protein GCM10008170_20310 [Methylopila capsulata]